MLNQKLQQKLLQKLSPQQVLVMRLLQEPILSFEQRIKQEIEENPALDESAESDPEEGDYADDLTLDSIVSDEDQLRDDLAEGPELNNEFSIEDYLEDEDTPGYRLTTSYSRPDEENREHPVISSISYQDFLLAQLGLSQSTNREFIIASTIIGNLDDAGYLRREESALIDDLAFNQNIQTTPEEVDKMIRLVQSFDPPGIGARDLRECLLLQLDRVYEMTPAVELATVILRDYFDEFSKRRFDKLITRLKISEEELKSAIQEIQKLNPKPGGNIPETSRLEEFIIPDFIIMNIDGELELTLNSRNTPELIVNRQYQEMLQAYVKKRSKATNSEKAAISFIKQKLDSAKGFIEAIKQRQETLYKTMSAIMEYQRDYFLTGDETTLRPMILKDIAEIVSMDISTISRVANSKYVQTPFGTFLLKSFFSESMQNVRGEEVSTREIKKILQDIIEEENKNSPFTDDQLVDLLKGKGYNIARRTISKYRKQLNIPSARLRVELQ
ncbi:MAG: RNA polymerase factor sigma-54 [Bacteroidales bacterium]|nr:RNA polymerase factor sigma-54 [Bacteroidales bacterium]